MKRFVSKEQKLIALALAVSFSLMLVFETWKALYFAFFFGLGAVFFKLDEDPPRWFRRTRLGRWWEHHRAARREP